MGFALLIGTLRDGPVGYFMSPGNDPAVEVGAAIAAIPIAAMAAPTSDAPAFGLSLVQAIPQTIHP